MIAAVTAFVPIHGHPRPEAEYRELGQQLVGLNDRVPLMFCEGELKHCWLYRYLQQRFNFDSTRFTYSIADNPKKNSLAYHIVQAQKTEWLVSAATVDRSDVFAWIDYGIFHIPGVTGRIIEEFLQRAQNERVITIPGCWENYSAAGHDDNWPNWRFCGGVMIVPREYIDKFDFAMKKEYTDWLDRTHNISWEVNTIARVEQKGELPIWWYKADHDKTIFTNYRATEQADGQQAQVRRFS